jgi:hypothetical protein
MIENMLGMDQLPLPVKLIVAFVIVLALIAAVLWVMRRLGAGRLGAMPSRGRQPRLAVIDAAAVDNRRRLVLIRRDNVEHLIMIGGPTDVVVEQNIVRAVPVAPPREAQAPRVAMEPPPRPVPEPALRAPADPQRAIPASERPPRMSPPVRPPRAEPARPTPAERVRPVPIPPEPELAAADAHAAAPNADANLADMAQKLEAALRRPPSGKRSEPAPAQPPTLHGPTPPTAPEVETNGTPRASASPAAEESKVAEVASAASTGVASSNAPRSVFDSLEEEMASLLAKPPAKP